MPKKQKKKFNARCADLLHLWLIEAVGEDPQNPDNALLVHVYLGDLFLSLTSLAVHHGDALRRTI